MERDQSLASGSGPQASAAAERCPRCGTAAPLIHVHGHGQCSACGSNIHDCCQGSDCDLAPATRLPAR